MSFPNIQVNLQSEWRHDVLGRFGHQSDKKTPFEFRIFPNLLDEKLFSQLREDINSSVRLKRKDNDLYKFKQSKDLVSEVSTKKLTPLINQFINVLLGEIRHHLENTFATSLTTKPFDVTVSRYDVADYLLCHNDDIKDDRKAQGRQLAFIYYLNTRPWTREDGGSLILYDSDSTGEPIAINNYIMPQPNTLVVFKTASHSWHSVEEVFCTDDTRLSINGWFHSDKLPPEKLHELDKFTEPCPYNFLKPAPLDSRTEKFFKECFNPDYLMEKTCFMIRRKFKRNSEINLTNFLVKEKFQEIGRALKETVQNRENLSHVGPYNKRNYQVIKFDKLPQICKDLRDAFQSELFFLLLSRLTGLDLQPPSLMKDAKEVDSESDDDDDDESDDDGDLSDGDTSEDDEEDSDDDDDDNAKPKSKSDKSTVAEVQEDGSVLDMLAKRDIAQQAPSASISKQKESQAPPKKRKKVSDPLARLEFRHLEHGSYTLLHDHAYELAEKSAVDVMLHFNHDFAVNFDDGGYISYLDSAPDEDLHDMDCELLTVEPKSNCLSVVYRCDEGTSRFLKYLSKTHKDSYQDLYCVYYERPDDLPSFNYSSQNIGGPSSAPH